MKIKLNLKNTKSYCVVVICGYVQNIIAENDNVIFVDFNSSKQLKAAA
jgi:hypothetical protein